MRVALWFLGLFSVAVAVALFAGNNQGTITVFWPPYRVDLSLNLVVLVLALLFFTLHIALRALAAAFSKILAKRGSAETSRTAPSTTFSTLGGATLAA